jgi:flavin-dependent dehydrogenase
MRRIVRPEILDTDQASPEEVRDSLIDLQRINRWFGGTSTMEKLVDEVLRITGKTELTMLDIASATGDIPQTIQRRLRQRGVNFHYTLLDRELEHFDGNRNVHKVRADALALPFRESSFDVVGCSLFAHHLQPCQVSMFAIEAVRVSRFALLINDLRRSYLHLAAVHAGAPLFRRITRNDSVASVWNSYTMGEMRDLLKFTRHRGVIGAGPAGCAAAITATRAGMRVLLAEKGRYPRHKVCGEFVSPESHHVLVTLLGQDHPLLKAPPQITGARMFVDGSCFEFTLPEPAWSIARYELDAALWESASAAGVRCGTATVQGINAKTVRIGDCEIEANAIVNATGRWSNLRRPSLVEAGPRWIGVKAHFAGECASPSTDIYFFPGGYCGVQPIGDGCLNASAMVRADVATSLQEVFAAHPQLWLRSRAWERITETVTTSPLIHAAPEPVTKSVMNVGDAAAFIDPFTGDGISLALRSGVLAAECAIEGGPERYAREYHARFARAFHTAAFTRKLSRAPEGIRRVAAVAFRSRIVKDWALRRTRGS